MNVEAIILASIPGLLAFIGVVWQAIINERKNKNKPDVDSSEAMKNQAAAFASITETLAQQGKSMADLFNDLSEISQLRAELRATQSRVKELAEEVHLQSTRANFFIRFAQDNWGGAHHLFGIVKLNGLEEQAKWKPVDRFPTGPLAEAK